MIKNNRLLTALLVLVTSFTALAAEVRYEATEVKFNAPFTVGQFFLNDQGCVAAHGPDESGDTEQDDDEVYVNLLWKSPTDCHVFEESIISITDMNDLGEVVGMAKVIEEGRSRYYPYIWTATEGVRILRTSLELTDGPVVSINNHSEVLIDTFEEIFIWKQGHMESLTLPADLPKDQWMGKFNDAGEVLLVGENSGAWFVVKDDKILQSHPRKRTASIPVAINNAGDVLTLELDMNEPAAISIWTHYGVQLKVQRPDADILLIDMNDHCQAVGGCVMRSDAKSTPILFTPQAGLKTLVDASDEWILDMALAINNNGQILVHGCQKNDPEKESFLLLTPY